jgi:hypothetical protein
MGITVSDLPGLTDPAQSLVLVDWAVRTYRPLWADAAGLATYAATLRAQAAIADATTWSAASAVMDQGALDGWSAATVTDADWSAAAAWFAAWLQACMVAVSASACSVVGASFSISVTSMY